MGSDMDGSETLGEIERSIAIIHKSLRDGNIERAQKVERSIYSEAYRRVRIPQNMEGRLNQVIMARIEATTAIEHAIERRGGNKGGSANVLI